MLDKVGSYFERLYILCKTKPKNINKQFISEEIEQNIDISVDCHGIQTIHSTNINDCMYGLGYSHAKDRLFQMDYLRRKGKGKLSEVFGKFFLEKDKKIQCYQFERIAENILKSMDEYTKQTFQSYRAGINDYIKTSIKHWEFQFLKYDMDKWEIIDTIIIFLDFCKDLSLGGEEKICYSELIKTVPKEIVDFIMQDGDFFNDDENTASRQQSSIPKKEIRKVLSELKRDTTIVNKIQGKFLPIGSNGWVVKKNGQCLIANDMHLPLTVPLIWYRANLLVDKQDSYGVTIPGIPILICGENDSISWGFTRFCGENNDMILVKVNNDTEEYFDGHNWKKLDVKYCEVKVKNEKPYKNKISSTEWGPIIRWEDETTAIIHRTPLFDFQNVNFKLMDLMFVNSVESGINCIKHFNGPPMNFIIGDKLGNIGWSVCGTLLEKDKKTIMGVSNQPSKVFSNEKKPEIINPAKKILVTANHRMIGSSEGKILGVNYFNGYRAKRIKELLSVKSISIEDNQKIQNDCSGEFYRYYYELILEVLEKKSDSKLSKKLKKKYGQWNFSVEKNSKEFPFIYYFYELLIDRIFNPLIQKSELNYFSWNNIDYALRKIIGSRDGTLIYSTVASENFEDKIFHIIELAYSNYRRTSLLKLKKWGELNKSLIINALALSCPDMWKLLNMPFKKQAGSQDTVKVNWPGFGASFKFITNPGRKNGVFTMPGGQSSHPFSKNYKDLYKLWILDKYIPIRSKKEKYKIQFINRPWEA